MVYLIHFDRCVGDLSNPRGQAQHYLGFCEDLDRRLVQHRKGCGAALLAWCVSHGIGWQVVRVWMGGRDVERWLKRKKSSARLCPICAGDRSWVRASFPVSWAPVWLDGRFVPALDARGKVPF